MLRLKWASRVQRPGGGGAGSVSTPRRASTDLAWHTPTRINRRCVQTRVRIMSHLTVRGPVFVAGQFELQAATGGPVLRQHQTVLLRELDPVTGTVIRRSEDRRTVTSTTIG